jgi:spore maturation protein CgeB
MSRLSRIWNRLRGALDSRSVEVLIHEELENRIIGDKPTVLYVGAKYDYGNSDWGLSFEHYNFFHTLRAMGYSLVYFDYDRLVQRYGGAVASSMLRQAVYYYSPDLLFYFHYLDWIDHEVWKEVSSELPTKTIIWLADDHWRFEETRGVWELFNVIVTTDREGYERRIKEGVSHTMLSQWGFNHYLYRRIATPKLYDLSFVGRCHGVRRSFVDKIEKYGVSVATFGQGWNRGSRVSQVDLIRIYSGSRISLNISLSSTGEKVQIKGRDFEVPGSGSLLLTEESEDLRDYFVPEEEIVTYRDAEDAAEKVRYYLEHDEERERICGRGRDRALRDHTMERRVMDIFNFSYSINI